MGPWARQLDVLAGFVATPSTARRGFLALADCDPCPLRARCTEAANGKWGRSLTPLPQDRQQILEQRRAAQQTDAWKERYDARAGVEGTPLPSCPPHPSAAHPLPRPGQDSPRQRAVRHRPRHHPHRRLVERQLTRHESRLPPCPSYPHRMIRPSQRSVYSPTES
ncbi:transposase [Streptomyces sp. NPDC001177]